MNDPAYPMTRVAANALMLALLLLAARLFVYVVGFVEGWRMASGLFELLIVAGIATWIGALGTVVFGLGLFVQTLRGRAHPRYISALVIMVALWFFSLLLPPAYRTGMTWSLWADGVDERSLVDFAAAARAQMANARPASPNRELLLGSTALQPLQNSHHAIFDKFPPSSNVDIAADSIDIHWGGFLIGIHGLTVFDRGPSPAQAPSDRRGRHRVSPRVFTFDHYD